jgi:hypothetical protein
VWRDVAVGLALLFAIENLAILGSLLISAWERRKGD